MECVHKAWTKNPNFMWNKSQKKKNVSDNKTTRAIILNNILWNMQQCQCIGWLFFSFSLHPSLFISFQLSRSSVYMFEIWKQSNNSCIWIMDDLWFITEFISSIYIFLVYFISIFYACNESPKNRLDNLITRNGEEWPNCMLYRWRFLIQLFSSNLIHFEQHVTEWINRF